MYESWRRDFILVLLTILAMGLLFSLSRQGRSAEAAPVPAATVTPAATLQVGDYVQAEPPVVHDDVDLQILAAMEKILAALEYLTEEQYRQVHSKPAIHVEQPAADTETHPEPTPTPKLSIWEDGHCWTPADMQVLHLCGADAGDGYVVRWIGVHGDSRGPEIPDADWLAARGGGDRLVWSGHHPATGELVSVTYWSGGHVLAVHAAGRLLMRINRNHSVTQ